MAITAFLWDLSMHKGVLRIYLKARCETKMEGGLQLPEFDVTTEIYSPQFMWYQGG